MAKDTSVAKKPAPTGEGYEPKRPVSSANKGTKLPEFGERYRMFHLAAHPTSWELVSTSEGWRLVPVLKRLILQAGVNWTKTAPKGAALDPSDLEAKAKSRLGFKVLDEVDEYLYGVQGASGEGHFLLWENVKVYSDGLFELSFDADGYDLWRWSLVQDKRVEAPRESVISQIRSRLKKAVGRATRTPHLAQAQEAKAEAEKRLAGLEEALAALRAPKGEQAVA